MPFRVPVLTGEEVQSLTAGSFHSAVAKVLNLLFGTRLTSWDLECAVGRYPVRLETLGRKTMACALWHNPRGDASWLLDSAAGLLPAEYTGREEGSWLDVGIRMALMAGIVSLLRAENRLSDGETVDISLTSGDFSGVMGAFYAKKLGLPIGKIICCCDEDAALWDLVHQGQLRTDRVSLKTDIPKDDLLPVGLERFVYECGGHREVERYLNALRRGGMYQPDDGTLEVMRSALHVSVVGRDRVTATVPKVFSSQGYVLPPYGALAYAGLQDHRVISGERNPALVLSETSPMCYAQATANALGIPVEELNRYI